MAIVDFFLVGAPKCGTTSLQYYLNQHSDILMSDPKEPHFFGSDLGGYRAHDDLKEYEEMFSGAGPSVCGEASVFYLMSKDAIREIKEYNSEAKIILMLRNPMDMLPSLHSQLLYTQDEDVEEFSDAWAISLEREHGGAKPRLARSMLPLQYRSCAKYADQIRRLRLYFPEEQIKIVLFEDFRDNLSSVVSDLFNFIGVDDVSNAINYEIKNPNTVNRYDWVARVLRHPPPWVKSLKRAFVGRGRLIWRDKIIEANTISRVRPDLDRAVLDGIASEYSSDVKELSDLIDRPLEHWLKIDNK